MSCQQVSGEGAVLDFLMDPTGEHVSTVSAAVEHEGCLFLGNLNGNYVSYVDVVKEVGRQEAATASLT